MPVQNGTYEQLTADEIRDGLEAALQREFGDDIDLTQSSVFTTLSDALARLLSTNQEQSLQDVYESAFLDSASGDDLDRVVAIIGLQRRSATHATGVQQFSASGPVTGTRVVQRGTPVQTESDEPIEFETTQRLLIELFDSFEDGDISEYSGDTNSGSVVTDADAPDGSNVLELDATADAHIYNDDVTMRRGSTNHVSVKPGANTEQAATFMVDPNNPGYRYQVVADANSGELRLERVEGGSVTNTIDTASVSYTADAWHRIEFRPSITGNMSATLYDENGDEVDDIGGTDHEFLTGAVGFISLNNNATKRFDFYTQSQASTNIRAVEGGTRGNVGANSLTIMPSPPTGVNATTNLYPTGNTDYVDTERSTFVTGLAAESDAELRARAEAAVTEGGDATHDAIVSELINNVEGVSSVSLFENKTDTDNTPTGLPPHSFEAVVFGGDDTDVAEAIFERKAVTSRDYAGVHGSSVSQTVVSDANGQQFTIEFSRPTRVNVDLDLDIVVTDTYIGDDTLRDRLVQYIGGTTSDDNEVVGLGVGANVVIDQVQDIVVGEDDTGVVAMDESVDGDTIESTPSATTVNGIEVINISDNEVAQTDGTDASITINKRTV